MFCFEVYYFLFGSEKKSRLLKGASRNLEKALRLVSQTMSASFLSLAIILGTTYSTIDGINVNRAKYGYSILYSASDFMKLDLKSFVLSMIQIFNNNIPGALINTTLEYNYAEMLDEHYDEA